MAIASAAIAAVGVGASIWGGAQKNKEGRKMQQQAQKMLDKFKWEDVKNAYENVQLSTVGTDLQREEQARNSSQIVDALRSSGTRGVLGGLGNVQYNNNVVNQQIAANLDQQDKNRQYAIAQDNTRIRDIKLRQQAQELAGLGQLYNVGLQTKYSGISDIASGIGAAGQLAGSLDYKQMGNELGLNKNPYSSNPVDFSQFNFNTPSLQQNNASALPQDYNKVYGGGFNYGMGSNFNLG